MEPLIRRVAEETYADALRQYVENRAQFWPAPDAFLLTEIIGDDLHVWLGAGRLQTLETLKPLVERWARAAGCRTATIRAKRWRAVFRDFAWDEDAQMLRKEL